MRSISRRMMLGGSAAVAIAATLAACSNSSSTSGGDDAEGGVYFLNFKPEAEAAWKTIAEAYETAKGVKVKVVTAASGTYEQTLQTEVAKSGAPTIFNVNGPVGLVNWMDYTLDLGDLAATQALTQESMALKDNQGTVYGIPLATEGYGLIYNKAILDKYFALSGAKATSVDEIKGFAKLKEVVEDMQARKDELGIEGVFAATSMAPGEDWRYQTHLANYPVFYEFRDNKVTDSDEITLKYTDNFKNIFDLYINNSTIEPSQVSAKTVSDSMADFALGKAAFVQNGNWAWSQIAEVEGNTVQEADIHFMPIYIGVDGEDKAGIAVGTENYLSINSQAPEASQQASKDFLNWLFTDAEGAKALVDNGVVSQAPYQVFAELAPADPLGKEVVEFINNTELYPVDWVFQTFPSQDFKDQVGQTMAQYAAGSATWDDVTKTFVDGWKAGKQA